MRKIPSLHEAHYLTYALDSPSSGGKLVNIDEVENGSACQCFCPACHEPLIAKNNGEIREHHFAHKSGTECEHAYESMLHLYAKEAIQQEFLSAKKFHITLEQKTYCSKKGDHVCSPKEEFCPKATKQHFNLKDYYDSCEQEVAYSDKTGRSDLKIYSSTNPDRKPIYVEFYVTHASCLKKLHSGNKIIEAKIESMDDIHLIKKFGFIERTRNSDENNKSYPLVNFYGFNRPTNILKDHFITRFVLYETERMSFFQWASCKCYREQKYKTSLLEIFFPNGSLSDIENTAKSIAYLKYKIKDCALCSFINNSDRTKVCKLNNLVVSDTSTAKTCQYFHIDEERMNKELSDGPKARYEIVYER